MEESPSPPALMPVDRPLNLIPVGLKEAALDSPTFRATSLHFAEQIDVIEKWLEGYLRAGSKLTHELATLEPIVNSLLQQGALPPGLSEAVIDHDYTLLAATRWENVLRESWQALFRGIRRSEYTFMEPIKTFMNTELKSFKENRRLLEQAQRNFDSVLTRYAGLTRSKEASSIREDAFQLHEARKAYLKASMDFCIQGPILRASLDRLLVKVFSEQWKEYRTARESTTAQYNKFGPEMERIRGWSKEMETSEREFKRELLTARKQLEDNVESIARPSRELEDYAEKSTPHVGATAPSADRPSSQQRPEKQGWLFIKTITGKPTRMIWSRRWFYVKHGIFGWLVQGNRSGGVEESEKVGVLLCSVRPALQEERRFCFEIKTKDHNIVLQAETQTEVSQWIEVFDVAKRKALEDPASTETSSANPSADLAFAISQPVAPEFAAKLGHGHLGQASEDSTTGMSSLEPTNSNLAARSSFDVTSARRATISERDRDTDGARDHAARIMSKLDLSHRKATPNTPASAGGVASLIAASHNVLPVGPGAPAGGSNEGRSFTMPLPISTLAPSTLANPPAPTSLSKTAVVVGGERGVSLSHPDGSGMPSGIMANLWGSEKWGSVNRLDRDNGKPKKTSSSPTSSPTQKAIGVTNDDVGVMDGMNEGRREFGAPPSQVTLSSGRTTHRKSISLNPVGIPQKPAVASEDSFPNYYPLPLKAQDTQFRLLFPEVPRAEKVVLVFRATWNPNEQQEFPGRVYVTAREIYFYSHHLGLVLITGASLETISEVTAAPGRDCDFLFLHFTDSSMPGELRRVTIKTFLEPLKLLQRRLSYLVRNAKLDSPSSLEEIMKALIKLEIQDPAASPSDSWEEVGLPQTDDETMVPKKREYDVKRSLRIDGNLYGDAAGRTGREITKFKLPAQAVNYSPQGLGPAVVVRDFGISAKALFHLIFGDKSAVFQTLYCNRWAKQVVQNPWTLTGNKHLQRQFSWDLGSAHVSDTQTIDVMNDHLCYVITEIKTPRYLPMSSDFHLVSKYVITHSAKSKCRLAVFHKIVWNATTGFAHSRRLVEKLALSNLEADAIDLTTVAMDQVGKLGAHSKTNRAIQIFGNVGQSTQSTQLAASDIPTSQHQSTAKYRPVRYTLARLYAEEAFSQAFRLVSMSFDILVALAKSLASTANAHTLLVVLLVVSALYNTWYGYRDGMTWYQERNAGKFMARLGVKADPSISRAIYLQDIDQMNSVPALANFTSAAPDSALSCRTTFQDVLMSPDKESEKAKEEYGRTEAQLHRTRHRLARYRHDLLVAMRVVNRVEEEVVQAEWEDWVKEESGKCDKMVKLLSQRSGKGKEGQVLGKDFEAYCQSCRMEVEALK